MRVLPALAAVLCLTAAAPGLSQDCTTPPGPGVNWQRCYLDGRDLAGHDLSKARLVDASFARSKLQDAVLAEVNAYRAKFISAEMKGAKLDGGVFVEADFTKADLAGASLVEADLRRSRLYRAILRGANLTGAKTAGADLLYADLSGATWIDGKRVCAEGSLGQCN